MVERGFVYGGRASFRALAQAAQAITGSNGPTTQTVIDIVQGNTEDPTDYIVNALADALQRPRQLVAEWAGKPRDLNDPYVPPDGSDRLTGRQRDALTHLIRVMVEEGDEDGTSSQEEAQNPQAPGSGAMQQDSVVDDLGETIDEALAPGRPPAGETS